MTHPIVYLNGEYLPLPDAKISVLDRGFIFGDGIYEVIPAYSNKPFRLEQHLQRMQDSLDAIRIVNPHTSDQWQEIITNIIQKNNQDHLSLYIQVTRGVAKRDHAFPAEAKQTVFCMANSLVETDQASFQKGIDAITLDDYRWQFCNIKATSLLPNVLLKQTAVDNNAQEAILIRDDDVTEGAASNIFIVKKGVIKTPPKTSHLLPGITRDLVVELARGHELQIEETCFTRHELESADEIWMTSSTKEIMPVVKLDKNLINSGKPGPVTKKMFSIFQSYKDKLKRT